MQRPFHFITPVWGRSYLELYVQLGLPCLLAPGNLPGAVRTGDRYLLYTNEEGEAFLRQSPAVKALQELLPVEFRSIGQEMVERVVKQVKVAGTRKYALASACYADAIPASQAEGAALVFLEPDGVWAEGFLPHMRRIMDGGARVLAISALQVRGTAFLGPFLARYRRPGEWALSIPPRELVALSMAHLHDHTKAQFWEAPEFHNELPGVLLWKVGEEGVLGRVFHMNPQAAVHPPDAPPFPIWGGLDTTEYITRICPDLSRIHVVTDSDDLFYASVATEHLDCRPMHPANLVEVAHYLKRWCSGHHLLQAQAVVRWHTGDLGGPVWDEAEARSEAVLRPLLALREAMERPGVAEDVETLFSHTQWSSRTRWETLEMLGRGGGRVAVLVPGGPAELEETRALLDALGPARALVLGGPDLAPGAPGFQIQGLDPVRLGEDPAYRAEQASALREVHPDLIIQAGRQGGKGRVPVLDLFVQEAGAPEALAFTAPLGAEVPEGLYGRLLPAGTPHPGRILCEALGLDSVAGGVS